MEEDEKMTEENLTLTVKDSFMDVKVGDTVTRLFYGIKMPLEVVAVDERIIHTKGCWTFDRSTGIEEDEELGFGVKFNLTCSILIKE